DRGLQVPRLRRERRHREVEVRDQVLQRVLVAGQRGGGARRAVDQPGHVAVGLGAEQRLEHLRGRALRRRDVPVGVVERLGGGLASSICMTTTAALVPGLGSIAFTLPTFTPAIRTGVALRIELADSNTALTSNGLVNGMSLVKPRNSAISATTSAISPIANG